MNILNQIQNLDISAHLPDKLLAVTQIFDAPQVEDVASAVVQALEESCVLSIMHPGQSVAVGVGSRGIQNLPIIVKAVIDRLQAANLKPFITPLMGSHGGATVEGQTAMIAGLGVSAETMGVEVRATMEVTEIGKLPNGPILYQDTISAAADHTLLINRVKPHTSFRSQIESGLAKMAVIGMGKQHGAATMHDLGVDGLRTFLAPAARVYEQCTNLCGGLAIVENAYDETAQIAGLTAAEIGTAREAGLLEEAKSLMASLPFPEIDVLAVRQLGKNISGTGMDTNVIGRLRIPRQADSFGGPDISVITVHDLTEAAHGNANGMGLANIITSRIASQLDFHATYMNALTSGILGMWRAHMPMILPDDLRALQVAVLACAVAPQEDVRLVLIQDTLTLDKLWVSPNLKDSVLEHPRLSIDGEIPLEFESGEMISPWNWRR